MRKTEQDAKGKPKASLKEFAYGVYVTYNLYTNKWHSFKREDAVNYWTGFDCPQETGDTAIQALKNYYKKYENS